MTIDTIINHMERLKQLHESLHVLSKKKTEALKKNDTAAIQGLMTDERKHVQAIEKIEKQRIKDVDAWSANRNLPSEQPTISDLIGLLEGEEKDQLQQAYDELILVLAELKQQEQLNSELTKQSLQFINLSLDMLQPSLQSMNYGNQNEQNSGQKPKRSVFDSKA
ncbi:flagellar protein FlgN [Halobacillus litoralis]|uniref:Flagellar protein FlgN n=1 Tax=Halobacillus litoralis TaxID=45668 RepID=A0A410MG56_9BACI|nr:flagellar protein FlgN [Halobacillus litoralis]QAS53701.1 flagellar protein FlgN [Halobacillus litoralis]